MLEIRNRPQQASLCLRKNVSHSSHESDIKSPDSPVLCPAYPNGRSKLTKGHDINLVTVSLGLGHRIDHPNKMSSTHDRFRLFKFSNPTRIGFHPHISPTGVELILVLDYQIPFIDPDLFKYLTLARGPVYF